MKNFYLVYPLLFGKFFEKMRGLKISNYRFFYNEKEKKYFWIFEANYVLLPNEKNLYFKVPFICDGAKALIFDAKTERGNLVKCVSEESFLDLREIVEAELDILNVEQKENALEITALGERKASFKVDEIVFLLVNLKDKLYVAAVEDKEIQVELFGAHSDFL